MKKIKVDKTASRGIAIAPIWLYQEMDFTPDTYVVSEEQIQQEIEGYERITQEVLSELQGLSLDNSLFEAHMALVQDCIWKETILEKVQSGACNLQQAIAAATLQLSGQFNEMDDEYMRERGADVLDIGRRFMAKCKGRTLTDLSSIAEPVIVVARNLLPSDTVKMNPEFIKGIITKEGGITGHVSIIAKNYGIPALTGAEDILSYAEQGAMLCMDARKGEIIINPSQNVLDFYRCRQKEDREKEKEAYRFRDFEPITQSGKRILLCANVGSVEEIKQAVQMNIDGVGLFRTEMLYMNNSHFPTEEEQFAVYKEAAELSSGELTIRTLDIGGDKSLPYYEFEREQNPFLGWRAIRMSLDMPDMFKEQLRAILRASAYGRVRMLFPMMISLDELRSTKALVEECKNQLKREGIGFDENIPMGVMMETPASVMLAEEFAKEADFFSIGTNDLTQYILAVDRGNRQLAEKFDPFHPAVMKAVEIIINAGHGHNRKVGMCGELAGDVRATSRLLRMGLDEFSMSVGNIDYVRREIVTAE